MVYTVIKTDLCDEIVIQEYVCRSNGEVFGDSRRRVAEEHKIFLGTKNGFIHYSESKKKWILKKSVIIFLLTNAAATLIAICNLVLQSNGVFSGSYLRINKQSENFLIEFLPKILYLFIYLLP